MSELDPHWEWLEIADFGKAEPAYIRGRCRHLDVVPVKALDGELIARLCLTCDQNFYLGSANGAVTPATRS